MNHVLLISIFTLVSSLVNAQDRFSFSDTAFTIGAIHEIEVLYQFNSYEILPESEKVLDSVYFFLRDNWDVIIEISNHCDTRSNWEIMSSNLTQSRADETRDYLLSKGLHPDRIVSIGFGGSTPLVSPEQIELLETKEEKEQAHARNRRTEVKIISFRT